MDNGRWARLIGAGFGLAFVLANAGAAPAPWDLVLRVVGGIAFAFGVVAAFGGRAVRLRVRPSAIRVYWVCVLFEVVAVVVVFRVLAAKDLQEYGVVGVALAVGLHFLPFGWAWRTSVFTWLGVAMTALGIAGAVLGMAGAGPDAAVLVAGVGSGVALLTFAALGFRTQPDGEQTRDPVVLPHHE